MSFPLSFYAQIKVLDSPNRGRLYLHKSGIEAYEEIPYRKAITDFKLARKFLHDLEKHYPWSIGILWGEKGERVIDYFGYSGVSSMDDMSKNPDVHFLQFRNGIFVEKPKSLTCGDGLIVLGREESHRRSCRNLEHYLETPPAFARTDIKYLV